MKPIAVYNERLISVSRSFALLPDRVDVHARWRFGGQYRNTVKLNTLKSDYRRLLIRHRWFRYGTWMMTFGLLAAALLIYRASGWTIRPGAPFPSEAWVGIAVAALGGLLAAITYQKVLFVRFDPISGRGGLDVAKSGPDRDEFENFIAKIQREIRRPRNRDGGN